MDGKRLLRESGPCQGIANRSAHRPGLREFLFEQDWFLKRLTRIDLLVDRTRRIPYAMLLS